MKGIFFEFENGNLFNCLILLTLILFFFFPVSLKAVEEINDHENLFLEASEAYKNGNYSEAFEKFDTLANLGLHDAQYNLAVILKSGKGIPKDYSEALYWSWRARLGGVELAIDQSEELIDYIPEKVLKDIRVRVLTSLEERISEGDSSAIMRLANYFLVILDEPDYEKAYLWYLVSAALLQDGGLEGRDEVEGQLESEKIIKIQKEAYELFLNLPEDVKDNISNGEN